MSLQRAFQAVMLLWGRRLPKRYGAHIAESVLSIICHIIKGESVVQEKLKGAENKGATSNPSAPASSSRPPPNPPVPAPAPQPEISELQLRQVKRIFQYLSYFAIWDALSAH